MFLKFQFLAVEKSRNVAMKPYELIWLEGSVHLSPTLVAFLTHPPGLWISTIESQILIYRQSQTGRICLGFTDVPEIKKTGPTLKDFC